MAEPTTDAVQGNRERRYVVARVADIPPGERLIVEVEGRSIGVLNVDGVYYALLNRCPHKGGALCLGEIVSALDSSGPGDFALRHDTRFLQCPWHGWEFDLVSGQSWFDPARMRARPFGIAVEHGDELSTEISDGLTAVPDGGPARFVDAATHRVKGPYQADVVPVTIEDDYIVISMRPVRSTGAPSPEVRDDA